MPLRSTLLALLVVLCWGLNFVVIDVGLADLPPLLFLALRFLLVTFPAVLFVPRPRLPWRWIAAIGLFLSFGQFALLYLSLAMGMPPGLASLVAQAQVVVTVVLSAIVLHERPTRRQIAGIVVGVIGLVAIGIGHGASAPILPFLVAVGAATSWAIGNVLNRHAATRLPASSSSGAGLREALSLVVWSGLVVPVPALLLSLLVDGPARIADALTGITPIAVLSTLYTVIAASLVGYAIWNSLLARFPAAQVVPFALLIPVVGFLAAWLVLDEVPSTAELGGGALMIAGLAIATVRPGSLRRSRTPPVSSSPEAATTPSSPDDAGHDAARTPGS